MYVCNISTLLAQHQNVQLTILKFDPSKNLNRFFCPQRQGQTNKPLNRTKGKVGYDPKGLPINHSPNPTPLTVLNGNIRDETSSASLLHGFCIDDSIQFVLVFAPHNFFPSK